LCFESAKMMIISCSETQQDTIRVSIIPIKESIRINSYSLPEVRHISAKDTVKHTRQQVSIAYNAALIDTTAVCSRNSIADITFWDPDSFVFRMESGYTTGFPALFIEKSRQIQTRERISLIEHLKQGEALPLNPIHDDWIIGVLLMCVILFSIIRTASKNIWSWAARFFLFKGIKDSSSRETGGLFQGPSKTINLISFLIIGLFIYIAASYYNVNPAGIKGFYFWLICLGIIISAYTLRYFVCIITGYMSGKSAVFKDYLLGVNLFYRFSALLLCVLIVLMSYTTLIPVKESLTAGIAGLGIMYFFRVLRLFIIYLNRNISIFYLILYLCTLEILPVVISVKYFTGLV
jgi:hypothetical protein